ncbi:MAG TPA: methyltransferase domain-containing protein [Verrucomicrobia bacterium]|nr:methyltransferase domain-containing protein [Verrucomicrobiota bacterium]
MTASTQWQLAREAAERYEAILVPAILGPAARALVEFARAREGEAVLDVGCGTGAAARDAARAAGQTGRVTGVDVNSGMIEVAGSLPPVEGAAIEWLCRSAYELPFGEESFDLVLCAQTLQFLQERQLALEEMRRVLKTGGRVAASLWCDIRDNPYFHALAEAVTRHIGAETALGLQAAFRLSREETIRALFIGNGYGELRMVVQQLDLELPPLLDFVPRHISATPMAAGFAAASPEERQAVVQEVSEKFALCASEGGVRIPFRTHLIQAVK